MKRNLLFNQLTAIGKRLAMVLTMLLIVGVGQVWGAYEEATSIAAGDVVLLVCESKKMELSGISTTSTKYGIGVAYTNTPAGAYELTVEAGSTSGTYSFKCPNGQYLYWTSGNTLATNATKSANTSWKVTFNQGTLTIVNAKDNSRKLQWNASSPRFACYTTSQTAVQLYKKVISKTLSSISISGQTTNFTVGDTFTFGGTVTATYSDKSTEDVTSSATFTGYNMSVAGQQTVTVSYEGKSVTYKITVSEPAKHKVYFYNGTNLLNSGGTEFAEGAAVSYSGTTPTSCDGESTTFVGWATSTWEGKVAKGDITPDFYDIIDGEDLPKMGTADVTYYSVFAKEGTSGSGTAGWNTVTSPSDLEAGAIYAISSAATGGNYLSTYTGANNFPYSTTTICKLVLGGSADAWTFKINDASSYNNCYLTATSTTGSNYLKATSTIDNYCKFSISFANTGNAVITCTGKQSRNILRYNPTNNPPIFACYSSGQSAVYLQKYSTGSTTTYSDYITTCSTKPTVYKITYDANGGEGTIIDNTEYTNEATVTVLGNFGKFTNEGYAFTGWNTKADGTGNAYKHDETFTITTNTTLYAQWCKAYWKLVTNASELENDTRIVIAAKDENYALSTDQKTNNRGQAEITKKYNTITFGADVQTLSLVGLQDNKFALYTGSGYLYAAGSGPNNYLKTGVSDGNDDWRVSIYQGVATILAQGTNTNKELKYNAGSDLFSCYGEDNSQKDVVIYKEVCVQDQYNVASTLTNATAVNTNPTTVASTATTLTLKYSANTRYLLPETITVKMGGVELISGTDYTWTRETGQLVFDVTGFFGDIDVKIVAEEDPCYGFAMSEVTATSTTNSITLSWTAVEGAKNYNVTLNPGDFSVSTGKISYTFEGLSPKTPYTWEVQAVKDGDGFHCEASKTGSTTTQKESFTITWLANGHEHHVQTDVEGTAIEIPAEPKAATYACDDKVFVGWLDKTISGSTNEEPTFVTDFGTIQAAKTYHAVYATLTGTPSNDYNKITDINDLTDGEYVIAYSYDSGTQVVLKNTTKGATKYMNASALAPSSNKYTSPSAEYIWQLQKQDDGSYYMYNSSVNKFLYATTSALQLSDNPTKYTISYDNTYSHWKIKLTNNTSYYMHGYVSGSSYDFRVSTSGSGNKYRVYLYKNASTAVYSDYSTTCVVIPKHNVTYNIGDGATGTAPTETSKAEGTIFTLASTDGISKEGYSFAGWLCDNDSKIYGASEEYTMPAADVTFTAQWNELPKYTVTFYNKGKKYSEVTQTTAFAAVECPTGLVACDGYTFAGWSTEELDGVSTFSKIEGEYTPTENITLYAVYAEGNVTTNGWVKVTELSTITEGTYALLSNNNYAFNGTINNNSDGEHTTNSFVFNGEGVASEAPSGTCEIELIASGDGFKMYSEGKGYLYAKAAKSGNLAWSQTENSSWSWNSTKSNWVYAENDAFLRSYNNTFRTYGTNTGNAIYFAKKNVTSFTTSPACDPMITIGSPEPVMVTSAKDIRVDAVQNITISATNLDQNADAAQVSIKLVSSNSAFKFKEVGANGDDQATPLWTGIANATFDKTLCVTYTPTVAGQEETATLTVTAYRHNASTVYATATMQVRGRSLPEQFVLVANTGDGWVALPNTLGTGSTASIPYPIAVEVDNDANPTSIPLAPSTTIYKAAARSTVNTIPTGLRFTTETGGYMQASTTETNIWLASNNSENMQSWTLNSTDFVDYSIRVNNAAEGNYLNYSNTQKKIGNYKSDNKLRILPIEDICEQHAAPENIDVVSVSANAATIQWDAVATATSGYEYRIGTIGEWTKVGNVTELELTKLSSLTNYIVYVRASVEGTNTNCSYEAEAEFTTLNCDDVPYDIHYASGANSVTVYWTCEAATSTISLYRDKEGLSLVETKTSVTSPFQFTGLDKFTTYYVQIQAGGYCPSGMIQVSTEQLDLDVVEWMSDGVVVDVNTDETITVTLENEVQYGSGVGQVAEELFFSKYFEGSGNLKLLAIYNGTGKDVDLSTYRIDRGSNGNATKIGKIYNLSQLGTIKNGQEIIFYSKPSSGEYPYTCSQSFLASKTNESGIDANPRWILCDNAAHNGVNFETMDFNGDDPLLLYKGNTLIDVFGVSTAADRPSKKTQCAGRSEESWSAAEVTNMDYGKTEADFEGGIVPDGVDLLNPTITAYTARVIMFRKNTVLSGSNAVAENITDFVTLASEWEVRSVCKSGDDGNLTCGAYQELGKFNYADYYTKYETIPGEQVFDENARLDDGTIKISIPNLSTYSCKNIKFNVKIGGVTINQTAKVPILIADKQSTNEGDVFANLKTTLGTKIVNGSEVTIQPLDDEQLLKKCEVCDIVVLANGRLTHDAEGIAQFNDLTIYPNGVFHNTSNFNVNRLLIHAQNDEVGCAIIENKGVTLTTNAIAHTKRIDAQYWYPFSLPYDCDIADITQANGESLGTYGVHWGIQYYDGKKRQESGTSAGIGQSSNFWTPIYNSNEQLKAYQGYMIALFDASVSSPTEMRTIYFPPVSAQMYTESGTDSKETTITSWNDNLEAEARHHGWNFTGSPYISVFNPQATGLTEDRGLISKVLMKSGYYDPETNEYLYDDNNVYVSVPSPNGAKYYDQYITSATSLKPFTAYFVQAIDPTSGNDETQRLAYAKAGRELPSSAPARAAATKQRVLVELNITAPDGQTDNTGIWVDERYTTDYEIAADLTKMYATGTRPQLYTLAANNEKLAYNALPDNAATNIPLGLYAPVAGDYTLTLDERVSRIAGAESVELLYNNLLVANLLYQDYTITANKGTVNGYNLSIRRRAGVSTAVDNTTGNTITVIANDGYISLVGVPTDAQVSIYDMVGRLINTQYANGETVVNMPIVPQGVYNIVVANGNGYTTIKSVIK